jgi:glycerophosphoryl diester phosphodiesterase
MGIARWLEGGLVRAADECSARVPQRTPTVEQMRSCRIVSHRGEYDNVDVFENTLAAFRRVHDAGVWGVELDIRWTQDLQPVVSHDGDCGRLFGSATQVSELSFAALRKSFPLIPSLAEVVAEFGRKLHLMIEAKEELYPDPKRQNAILSDILSPLRAGQDYHVLALVPEMLSLMTFVSAEALLPVSTFNYRKLSRLALDNGYGGITGNYVLLDNRMVARHLASGQQVGTGFVASLNCLFRELNRGIRWVFSDHAAELQSALTAAIEGDSEDGR